MYKLLLKINLQMPKRKKNRFPRRGSNSRPSHYSANTAYKYDALTDWATGEAHTFKEILVLYWSQL